MRVALELPTPDPADSSTAANLRSSQESAAQGPKPSGAAGGTTEAAPTGALQPNAEAEALSLSFRRDSSGATYYVILNSQTGQVVREVPPKEIRQVGDGIEQYLKAQAALATPKTDTKA